MRRIAPIRYIVCLLFVGCIIQLSAYCQADAWTFYSNATSLAWEWDEVRYQAYDPQQWAVQYCQKHIRLHGEQTLLQHYNALVEFAQNLPIHLVPQQPDIWAKNLLLQRYCGGSSRSIAFELQEFIEALSWTPGEARKWGQNFLQSSTPFYSQLSPLQCHQQIADFLRLHNEFVYNPDQAHQAAKKFMQTRYHFSDNMSLQSQYQATYEYAISKNGLNIAPDKAEILARKWVETKGILDPQHSLAQQYTASYQFARKQFQLTHTEAQNWALQFFMQKARFPQQQSLTDQFQEAFIFAYSSDFLPFFQERKISSGSFLHIEAMQWARKLVETRGHVRQDENLSEQYREALSLAYSYFENPRDIPSEGEPEEIEDAVLASTPESPTVVESALPGTNASPSPSVATPKVEVMDTAESMLAAAKIIPASPTILPKGITSPEAGAIEPVEEPKPENATVATGTEPETTTPTNNLPHPTTPTPETEEPKLVDPLIELQVKDALIPETAPITERMTWDEAREWARQWMMHEYWP